MRQRRRFGRLRTRSLDGSPRPPPGGHPDPGLRRVDRPERRGEPAPDHDARRPTTAASSTTSRRSSSPAAVGRSARSHPCPASRRAWRRAATGPSSGSSARRRRQPVISGCLPRLRRPPGAVELMKVKIDALDLTVLQGGAADIGAWATASRLPASAGCSRGARLLRPAQSDLPRRRIRCRCRPAARPGDRRRDPGPHHDPDRRTRGFRSGSSPSARRPGTRSRRTSIS